MALALIGHSFKALCIHLHFFLYAIAILKRNGCSNFNAARLFNLFFKIKINKDNQVTTKMGYYWSFKLFNFIFITNYLAICNKNKNDHLKE